MQQANKSEQLELDELLSDIYRGIERLPDEPATALEQSHESYNHYNDDYHDRHFNHHTVSFATTTRRNSKELTERQIKEKAMIEELKRNFRSGALTLRNSFKSSSRDKQQQPNNTNTTNQSNLKAPSRYNTTNNRSTSRSPTPNRVTFMRQHSDLTNYRLPPSTKALNDQQQQTTNNMSKQPSTHYTINQQLIIPNGTTSNGTKQQSQQSILTSSSNTMQPQQKAIYANPHNSLLQHKRQQQYNLNQCSMREFDELDSLLNSLKITNTTNTNFMNNSRNNNSNNSNSMQLSNNSTNRQQNLDTTVPLYAKVQKNIPIQSNNHQNYHYKTTNNDASHDQQQSNTRIIPVHAAKDGQVIHTTHNNTTSGYYNPNNNNNNGNSNSNSNNGHGNNEDDIKNDDGDYLRHTTIENNQHQPIYGHYHKQNQQYHSESQDPPFDILPSMEYYQLLSKFNTVKNDYWYKPKMSRETAINLLRDKPPGTFIVRDSTSFNGAYGLAVKVAKLPRNVITNANLRNTNATLPNELIRHFLIESTTKGVRLKGYANEPVFSSLPALVYQHSITELALPCKLSIPRADVEDPKFAEKQRRFYEEVMAEKADSTKGIYGKSGTLGGMRNYEGVPIHSEHRIIFDRI